MRRRVFKYLKKENITCIVATHDKNDVLGFADRMIFLNNKKIETNDTVEHLFKHPKTPLIASFFDEFNIINDDIVYAHQLELIEKSNIKVKVVKSYFKGSYYLIESIYEKQTLFFENNKALTEGRSAFLKINK